MGLRVVLDRGRIVVQIDQRAERRRVEATTGTETVARETGRVIRLPSRSQVSRTCVPEGPLTSETDASCERPFRLLPAAETMTSPGLSPARLAGEPS